MNTMKMINSDLLLALIEETGLSYSQFSKISEVSRNTIYNIASGQSCPSIPIIQNIVNSLNMTQEEFLDIFCQNIKFRSDSPE